MSVSSPTSSAPDTPAPDTLAAAQSAPARARGRSRAATRERIVDAGIALFAERGLHDVTSHEIAAAAGVAAGTFYLHFPEKRSLFREIAFAAVDRLKERLGAARNSVGPEPEAVARAQAIELIEFAAGERDLVRILFGRNSEGTDVGADVLDHLSLQVTERLTARRAAGELSERVSPRVAAQVIVGMWSRVLAWWVEDPARADRESIVETLVTFELTGLFAAAAKPGGKP